MKTKKSLKILESFLVRVTSDYEREGLLGDFTEKYNKLLESKGLIYANLWYTFQILKLIPFYFIQIIYWSFVMLKNYLKTTLRIIRRDKAYSILNISGLVIGLTCTLLIFLYVQHELSYDRHHKNFSRIYKCIYKQPENYEMGTPYRAHSHPPLVPTLLEKFPEIETATRFSKYIQGNIKIGNFNFSTEKWVWADNNIFDVFTIPLLYGNPETALDDPYSLVIDESTSLKYFGKENPVGKTITFDRYWLGREMTFQVTGVMKNITDKSHFKPEFLGGYKTQRNLGYNMNNWGGRWFHSYILLKKGYNYKEIEKKIQSFLEKEILPISPSENRWTYILQPLTDIHLKSSQIINNLESGGDIRYVYISLIVAFIVLIISCMNYINLTTARSFTRSTEVGIRKVIGAKKAQLIKQFIGETLIFTLISMITAVFLVFLFSQPFSNFVERNMDLNLIKNYKFILFLIAAWIFTGVLSGFYPAFFLSMFKPVNSLKGKFSFNSKSLKLRNMLVIFQFSVFIFLIIVTLIVSGQLNFIRNKKTGYDREHVIVINRPSSEVIRIFRERKEELLSNPDIKGITISQTLPIYMNWGTSFDYEGRNNREFFQAYWSNVDYDFIDFFRLEIVSGRNFSREIATDITGGGVYILNETAVKLLGWENPIGKSFGQSYAEEMGKVIGIVRDFDSRSLHLPAEPVILGMEGSNLYYISVKILPGKEKKVLENLKSFWDTCPSEQPFNYSFLDEAYYNMYKSEIKLNSFFRSFSLIVIFISCLGLFGLVSYTTQRRTKEIAVRKTLGASIPQIIKLISKEFLILVIISKLIAAPLAYFVMKNGWIILLLRSV